MLSHSNPPWIQQCCCRRAGYELVTLLAAGDDQRKHDLAAALPQIFTKCKQFYQSRPDMTGAELYDFVCK